MRVGHAIAVICASVGLASCSFNAEVEQFFQRASQFLAAPQFKSTPKNAYQAIEDEAYSLQLEVEDIDIPYGDKISFSVKKMPGWLRMSREGLISGIAENDDVGLHEVVVRVTDRAGQSDELAFELDVINSNDQPIFVTRKLPHARQNALYAFQIKVHDDDLVHGDKLIFKGLFLPEWVEVSADGVLSGIPANADVGTDELSVEVRDSAGATAVNIFNLKVENVNDAPVFRTQ